MAFINANLLNSTGMPQSFADYVYISDTDTKATVLEVGYFHNLDDNQNLSADDLINVRGDQGTYTVKVISVSSGTITTTLVPAATSHEELTTTPHVILASETGKHFVLEKSIQIRMILPPPALDLEYWFHMGSIQVSGGSHAVFADSDDFVIQGSITSPDVSDDVFVSSPGRSINFVPNKAVHGDLAHVWCDGTIWYLDGHCFVHDGIIIG